MSRVTSKLQLESAFNSFARACGRRVARSGLGSWFLMQDSLGYTIYEVGPEGAVHCPVPAYSGRLSAGEMLQALYFAESALLACKKRRSRSSRGSKR